MKQYGVLVVDDSAFMRRAISQLLENDPQFFVVGIARNGEDAVEKVRRLRPDLVTMDVEMPKMNGLEALTEIMKTSPVPVVMLSSKTAEGATETIQALELGAVDFFLKENLIKDRENQDVLLDFYHRLKEIAGAKLQNKSSVDYSEGIQRKKKNSKMTDVIFIGCSTGGPSALQSILPRFPKDFPIPVVVAQHMPIGFTKALALRFNSLCQLEVKEIENGELLQPGRIYIAPSGFQTLFKKIDSSIIFKVVEQVEEKVLFKPCIDISLASAAPIFQDRLLTVILTGMGSDGMIGCGLVKKFQGHVFVESEESSVVYGMPKSVMNAGYADGQYPLSRMYQEIESFVR
ncbi:protein-glutamate methylesterase/protein-glutamine glutaminase [Pseudoneobacillus sp. C159]